ncbi:hypothetical protein ADUPG1_007926 [Aduncisulcus paluster]|uniref:Uncharacterized protein n=1 Tax=Aduncisulcus paluster TaxID=2918883 RepID=A0ABQ5KQ13_9EUKA|nr:hypothetical protein ADUPG1_007926 [Aduncisulcus paluster]
MPSSPYTDIEFCGADFPQVPRTEFIPLRTDNLSSTALVEGFSRASIRKMVTSNTFCSFSRFTLQFFNPKHIGIVYLRIPGSTAAIKKLQVRIHSKKDIFTVKFHNRLPQGGWIAIPINEISVSRVEFIKESDYGAGHFSVGGIAVRKLDSDSVLGRMDDRKETELEIHREMLLRCFPDLVYVKQLKEDVDGASALHTRQDEEIKKLQDELKVVQEEYSSFKAETEKKMAIYEQIIRTMKGAQLKSLEKQIDAIAKHKDGLASDLELWKAI